VVWCKAAINIVVEKELQLSSKDENGTALLILPTNAHI
jgi:hypothetical protein